MDAETQSLHTNSCIELSIPHEYHQWGPLSFFWKSTPVHPTASPLAQYLTYQSRGARELSYYLCSPLDVGAHIDVRIEQDRHSENVILEQLRYGPVGIEDGLLEGVLPSDLCNVEIMVGKAKQHTVLEAEVMAAHQAIKISVTINNNQFVVGVDATLARRQLNSFQRESFFKLYDAEPSVLGINVSGQGQEIIENIRNSRIYCHQGSFVKIYFKDRACRDIFLLKILMQINLKADELQQFGKRFAQFQNEYILKPRVSLQTIDNKSEVSKEAKKIPRIQSIVRKSQITNFEVLTSFQTQNETPKVQQDILQDIYNILYNPIASNQRFNTTNPSEITLSKAEDKSTDPIGLTMSVNFMNGMVNGDEGAKNKTADGQFGYGKSRTEQKGDIDSPDNRSSKSIKLKGNSQSRKLFYSKKQPANLDYPPMLAREEQSPDKLFDREVKDIQMMQKILELTKTNQQLVAENKRLRMQNQKLKSDETKYKKAQEINKMIEIKAMVQMMAKKLEVLERGDQQDHKTSKEPHGQPYRKKSYQMETQKQKIYDRQPILHETMRLDPKVVWSPRTHDQIVKHLKQKRNQMTGKDNKSPQFKSSRKKSINVKQPAQSVLESPFKKPNLKSLKQCSSAGSLNPPQRLMLKHPKNPSMQTMPKPPAFETTTFSKQSTRGVPMLLQPTQMRTTLENGKSLKHTQSMQNIGVPGPRGEFRNVFGF